LLALVTLNELLSIALCQPLRKRVQQLVDRRFYRSKYDVVEVLGAFSATVCNEVDLD
jgi:hypothetical protein